VNWHFGRFLPLFFPVLRVSFFFRSVLPFLSCIPLQVLFLAPLGDIDGLLSSGILGFGLTWAGLYGLYSFRPCPLFSPLLPFSSFNIQAHLP